MTQLAAIGAESRTAAEIGLAQDALDRLRAAKFPGRAYLRSYYTVHCRDEAEVDDFARQWHAKAGWTLDATSYEFQVDEGYALTRVMFMPDPARAYPIRQQGSAA